MSSSDQKIRTQAQAVMEVRYACHYGELNERFWRHIDTWLNLLGALGGSAAVAALLGQSLLLSGVAGVVMAVASTCQMVLRPLDRAYDFRDARRAFAALDVRAWSLSLADLDAQLKPLQAESPVGFRWLGMPAFNLCMLANGEERAVRPLSWPERIALAIA